MKKSTYPFGIIALASLIAQLPGIVG